MKTTFTILFIASFLSVTAQSKFQVNEYCENPKAPFDLVVMDGKKVKYQIIGFTEMKFGKWNGEYSVNCILPDYSSKSSKIEIKKIAVELKKLNSKFTKFTFFKNCEAYRIFISSTFPIGEEEKKLKYGYLGEYEITD